MDKRVIMFCGKGGVGKTTCAAATALHFATSGKRTLIISTDLTPSLRDIFEIESGGKLVEVTEDLYLHEIGYDEIREMWERKFGPEVYEVFSTFVDIAYPDFVDFVASILPGIRDEFMVDYIKELSESGEYKAIVWDTAPAGQTLGLLQMPAIINQHLKPAPRIYSALKTGKRGKRSIMQVIRGWEELSNKDIEFLKTGVEFNLVTIPEALAVRQLDGIFDELRRYGLEIDRVIINQVIREPDSEFLRDRMTMQQGYIEEIVQFSLRLNSFSSKIGYGKPCRFLPLFSYEIRGIERLKEVERFLFAELSSALPINPSAIG